MMTETIDNGKEVKARLCEGPDEILNKKSPLEFLFD